ncbi:MAG: DUF1460 domain-containing protein [Bacteroidia bacterium]|nr:DUF1460 domain-containing protein [Bacteroidia bacterium]
MKRFPFFLFLGFFAHATMAQISCTPENMQRLQRQISHHASVDYSAMPIGEVMVEVGKGLLGTPYVAQTLEIDAAEPLVINLTGLDCTTFLENAVVFSRLLKLGNLTEQSFQTELEALRYRDGVRDGYGSRLHYFTEWMLDNEEKGVIRQISEELGGSPWQRPINFMTTHANLYPFLQGAEMMASLSEAEARLSTTKFSYLPKAQLASLEGGIQNGDLIAITTTVNGLDIAHVGFAIWVNGRVHLFHASSSLKKVVISDVPLADYLAGNKSQSGVMVCRLASLDQ